MNDKQKQIEEMAKIIDEYLQGKIDGNEETLAQIIYDKILPEGSVVISKDEYEEYRWLKNIIQA